MARRPVIAPPMFTLRRNALYKGFLGGSRGWMTVGAFVWGSRLMKKSFGRAPQYLSTERLDPGQGVRIEAVRPTARNDRRAARRAR